MAAGVCAVVAGLAVAAVCVVVAGLAAEVVGAVAGAAAVHCRHWARQAGPLAQVRAFRPSLTPRQSRSRVTAF